MKCVIDTIVQAQVPFILKTRELGLEGLFSTKIASKPITRVAQR